MSAGKRLLVVLIYYGGQKGGYHITVTRVTNSVTTGGTGIPPHMERPVFTHLHPTVFQFRDKVFPLGAMAILRISDGSFCVDFHRKNVLVGDTREQPAVYIYVAPHASNGYKMLRYVGYTCHL